MIRLLIVCIVLAIGFIIKIFYKGLTNSNMVIKVCTGLFLIIIILSGFYLYSNREERAYNKLIKSISIEKCQEFLLEYPQSDKYEKVVLLINDQYKKELSCASDSISLDKFIRKYSNSNLYKEEYKKKYLDLAIVSFNKEIERLREERIRKEREENHLWNSDRRAWKTTLAIGNLNTYKKYLTLYPNGEHKEEAERIIIDLEVANVFESGDYGQLPSMDRTGSYSSIYSTITIKNDTQYTLTILYSGMESKRLVLSPNNSESIRIKSGSYKIVASVDNDGVQNFAGHEELSGGSYEVTYYIRTY